MFQPYIEMSWFLAKYTILFASLPQVITISQNIFCHWCINCSYFSRCLLLCKHMLTLLLQSLLCPHSRFPVKFIQFSLLFWSHALPRALRKNLAIFSVCLWVRCPLFFQRAYLPAQYMLYAVKLQGIYTAYSYLSVRATVDLPLPENSIHALLFQLRLLAQRLLFALTSKPQKDVYYISYRGKLSKKLPKRYK